MTTPRPGFDAKRLKRELPSTWENVSQADMPKEIQFIKHVTPTHSTWVVYDREKNAITAVDGRDLVPQGRQVRGVDRIRIG